MSAVAVEREQVNSFSSFSSYSGTKRKPAAIEQSALHGISGEFARLVMPQTESALEAVLIQFLAMTGVYLGRTGYYQVESDRHYTNLFCAIVGETAKGRKGTSWSQARRVLTLADGDFCNRNLTSGLSSGEGLIWAVRDEIRERTPIREKGRVAGYEEVISDPGVADKRLLVVESEFARALKSADRDGNTLSPVVPEACAFGKFFRPTSAV